ncbi:MAG: AAA family ATPase [Brevundimonas sp.]
MTTARRDLLKTLADELAGRRQAWPLRVAIDGPTAAGKTTLADELAECLVDRNPVIRAGLDGFHRPRALRYERGRRSAVGYYEDARDYAAMRRELLDPLGPEGDRRFRRAIFDLDSDAVIDAEVETAAHGAILIVDGTFLQRAEFDRAWDVVVFLDVDPATSLSRGAARDAEAMGGLDAAIALYQERYLGAWRLYVEKVGPVERADIVISHNDPSSPVLIRSIER